MNQTFIRTFLLFLLTGSILAFADEKLDEEAEILKAIAAYEERSWEFGLAAGYGAKTNPLVNSDDIPMYAVLNIAWFGDYFFFDNGDLGLTIHETDQFSFNLISHLNNEREIFEWLNTAQLGIQFSNIVGADFSPPPRNNEGEVTPSEMVNFDFLGLETSDFELPGRLKKTIEIPNRSLAVDGGLEIIYSNEDWGDIQLQLLSDISFTHKGFEVWASYAYPWRKGNWTLVPSVGLNWKSSDLLDYYYGVREDETLYDSQVYQASSGVNSFLKLSVSYRINDNWGIVGVAEYESLSRSIRRSPIVDQDSIKTFFIGLMYKF